MSSLYLVCYSTWTFTSRVAEDRCTSSMKTNTVNTLKRQQQRRQTLSSHLDVLMLLEYNRGGRERLFGHEEVQRTWHGWWGAYLTHTLLWGQRMRLKQNESFFFLSCKGLFVLHLACPVSTPCHLSFFSFESFCLSIHVRFLNATL